MNRKMNVKRKKRRMLMLRLIALTLALGLLPACSSQSGTDDQSQETRLAAAIKQVLEEKQQVDITFWTGTGAANYPYLEEMVNSFMEQYPNIKVELSNQGAIADLTNKLTQNIVAKTTPVISNISPSTFPEYIEAGAIVDLAPFYHHETIGYTPAERDDFFPSYIREAESFGGEGTLYGFPTNKKTANILVYNRTYFLSKGWEAPRDWEDVAAKAKAIYEETGKPGFSYDTSYGEDAFYTLSRQYGSPLINQQGEADLDNDGSRRALRFYKENMDAGYFTLPALMPSAGGNNSSNGFINEECYMFVGASAGISYAVPKADSGKEFEVGVAPVPQISDEQPVYYSKGEDYCVFANANLQQQVAAWLLIKHLSEPENNIDWYINTGNQPIRQSTLELERYQDFLNAGADDGNYHKAQAVGAVLSIQDKMSSEKPVKNSSALAKTCGTMWTAVMIGGEDVEAALAEAIAVLQ